MNQGRKNHIFPAKICGLGWGLLCLISVSFLPACGALKTAWEKAKIFVHSAADKTSENASDKLSGVLIPQDALTRIVKPIDGLGKDGDAAYKTHAAEQVNATYYFLLGHRLSNRGKAGQALAAFDQLKKIDGDNSNVYFYLAQEYLKKGLMAEGVAAAKKSLEIDPKNKEAKVFLANLYATAKKYSEAITLFEEVAKEDPDDEDVMLYLALIETEQKQTDKAYKRIHKFLETNPDSALAFYYLGRLEQEKGQNKEAMNSYKKAIDIRPGFIQAGTFLGFLQEEMGDRTGAIETYSWLSNQTDDANYHKKLGHLLLDDNQYQGALKAFENYERIDKADLNNKVKIALVLVELKEYDKAIAKFEEVLKDAPESENVRYYLGAVLEQKNELKRAVENYAKIPPTSKLYGEAFKRRVYSLARLKNEKEGWKLVEAALKAEKNENLTLEDIYEAGVNFLDAFDNKTAEAMTFLAGGLEKLPKSERLLYLKGSLYEKSGDSDKALEVMRDIVKLNPNSAQALNFVGYSWAEKGKNLAQAEAYVKKALKLKPKDPFISDSLAWVYYKLGRYKDAKALLEEAFALRPDEAVIADHLGDVLVKLGRLEEARKYYEIALKLGPTKEVDRKNLQEKLARLQGVINSGCNANSDSKCARLVFEHDRTPAAADASK